MGFLKIKLPIEFIVFFVKSAAGNKNTNCHDDDLPGKISKSILKWLVASGE